MNENKEFEHEIDPDLLVPAFCMLQSRICCASFR